MKKIMLCSMAGFFLLVFAAFGAFAAELEVVTPTDGQTDVSTNASLIWKVTSGDEDVSDQYTYEVYFGTTNQDLEGNPVASPEKAPAYTPSNMAHSTTYLWRIKAVNAGDANDTLLSAIWRFTTGDGDELTFAVVAPPDQSDLVDPEEIGEALVPVDQSLQWKCTFDDVLANNLSYTVRLGQSSGSLEVLALGLTDMLYSPALEYGKIYYWQIQASAADGTTWIGPIWKFYTMGNSEVSGGCSLGYGFWGGIFLTLPLFCCWVCCRRRRS